MIVCPGCHAPAPGGTFPSVSLSDYIDSDSVLDWWCRGCLATRVAAAHGATCTCVGCRREATR